jgi:hypothetical protein
VTEPRYFTLDTIIDGMTAAELGDLYTMGQCYELAVGFNDRYGWPVHLLCDQSHVRYLTTSGSACHAIAQAGPDLFVDIYGIKPLAMFEEEWCLGHRFKLRPKTAKGLARHFSKSWTVDSDIGPGSTTAKVLDALHPQIQRLIGTP